MWESQVDIFATKIRISGSFGEPLLEITTRDDDWPEFGDRLTFFDKSAKVVWH